VKRLTGETTGQVLSCETGPIPRCRSHSVEEKATSSHGEWLAWEEPRAVGDLVHVDKFNQVYLPEDVPHAPYKQGTAPCKWLVVHSSGSEQEGIVLLVTNVRFKNF
jgi:hypothetical protein